MVNVTASSVYNKTNKKIKMILQKKLFFKINQKFFKVITLNFY